MSSIPDGYDVEDYVYEAWMNLTEEQFQFIIETYNSNVEIVDYIQDKMLDYDEEYDGSWRTYRNCMAELIDEEWVKERKVIDKFLGK